MVRNRQRVNDLTRNKPASDSNPMKNITGQSKKVNDPWLSVIIDSKRQARGVYVQICVYLLCFCPQQTSVCLRCGNTLKPNGVISPSLHDLVQWFLKGSYIVRCAMFTSTAVLSVLDESNLMQTHRHLLLHTKYVTIFSHRI